MKINKQNLTKDLSCNSRTHLWSSLSKTKGGHELTKCCSMVIAPMRIEILTSISGVNFEECYQQRVVDEIDGIKVNIIGLEQLKINKKASGRYKDSFISIVRSHTYSGNDLNLKIRRIKTFVTCCLLRHNRYIHIKQQLKNLIN